MELLSMYSAMYSSMPEEDSFDFYYRIKSIHDDIQGILTAA